MDIRTAAQEIRDRVTMEDIVTFYGYQPRKGFICCPFHGEKAGSLKIYKDTGGWHCFGCGRGGSVIDFVMEHENVAFPVAVRAIDRQFKLGLLDPHENPVEAGEQLRAQEWLDRFVSAVSAYCEELIRCIEGEQKTKLAMVRILEEKRDRDIRSVTADEWTEILRWKSEDEYDEYRKKKVDEFMEEVAAWRRKARRAKGA